jgi:hypothetical protein
MSSAAVIPHIDPGLLAGYGCSEQGPYLVLDRIDATPWARERFAVRNRTFTLETSSGRYCTGRHDLATGESLPCPVRSAPSDPDLEQCSACYVATGFNPAFYHAAQVSPQQRRRNRQPHVVYLVSFGAGGLKVGMTFAPRRLSRLLEQGARLGAVIASFETADQARELEANIASSCDVAEVVRAARKRHLLGAPFSMNAARLDLAHKIESIHELWPEVVEPHPEILELDRHYAAPGSFDKPLTDLSESEPLGISGHCLGMIGDVVVMAQGTQRFMLSVGLMLGRQVRLSPLERPNHFVGQLGLPF